MLQISPHAIEYMPCNVLVYSHNGKTLVKTHLLPVATDNDQLNAFSKSMNEKLKLIVDFAVED